MTQSTIMKILPKITVKSITDIDIINQTFRAELDYELKWEGTDADYEKYRCKLLFPKFKPIISILNAQQSKCEFKMKRRTFDEDTISYKCVKDSTTPGVNWIVHSFTVQATFYNTFQTNMHRFPFDSHTLHLQISINKLPSTWDDGGESGIIFEIDKKCIVNDINSVPLPVDWEFKPNTIDNNNPIIETRLSHKPLNERVDLLLNGFANTIEHFEEDVPSDLITLINTTLGENKDWMNEPPNQHNIIDVQLELNRNQISLYFIYRILLITFLITFSSIASVFTSTNFGQSFLHCTTIIVTLILIQLIFVTHYKLQSLSFTTLFDKYVYCCIAYVSMIVFVNYGVSSFTNTMNNSMFLYDNNCIIDYTDFNINKTIMYWGTIAYFIVFVVYHMYFYIFHIVHNK